ncbi:MAG: class I SAM-dependent methyltransferase [Acidimicrobiales bacterium]
MFGRPDRARYGIDGGFIALSFYAALSGPLVAASLSARRRGHPGLARLAAAGLAAVACSEASFLYSTGPGKRSIWSELLNALDLEGDEHVLDVGCGRGAVLIAAAHRLPKGRAVGVDIWRRRDQSGNRRSATEHNSVVEGVAERVELVDGDARDLPFPPESFEVVVSSLALNNIRSTDERARALREAARVLRPGGQLRVVDDKAADYAEPLRDAGCVAVTARTLDWRTWFGLPGHHLELVMATKGPRSL